MKPLIALLVVVAACAGCSTALDVGRYGVSAENDAALKKLGGRKVSVGPFTATEPGRDEIRCRDLKSIKTPDRAFEDYIRQALIDELAAAGLLAESAPITLTGHLNRVDFDSLVGEWTLDLTLTSSNGRALTVSDRYRYQFIANAEAACARTAASFPSAVQALLGKLVSDGTFAELLR
jgi:hypothetical protein